MNALQLNDELERCSPTSQNRTFHSERKFESETFQNPASTVESHKACLQVVPL